MYKKNKNAISNITPQQLERLVGNSVTYHEIYTNNLIIEQKPIKTIIADMVNNMIDDAVGSNKNIVKFSPQIQWSLDQHNMIVGLSIQEFPQSIDNTCRIDIKSNLIGIPCELCLSNDSQSTACSVYDAYTCESYTPIKTSSIITSFNDYIYVYIQNNKPLNVSYKYITKNTTRNNDLYWERLFQSSSYEVSMDTLDVSVNGGNLILQQKIKISVPEIHSLQDAFNKKYMEMFAHDFIINYM